MSSTNNNPIVKGVGRAVSAISEATISQNLWLQLLHGGGENRQWKKLIPRLRNVTEGFFTG